ncbi:hypothetical protein [Pseudomonas sp. CC120222-01a]|uniref:hypothetical protein n=1 Tax=Pseudomonas sp. CC120222-01a TaxID=1378075 RepID=UPI000D903BA2|nr:hypothetical protein [Pseudomonas sp. CC120222-01a]PVZ41502.1 hypothetical protein N430_02006 [Pseudomonas sp. CC120222-01a]
MADGCYNHIYSVLVESDQDTLGIIAYSLYKRQKIEFIQSFKVKHDREPKDIDLAPFHDVSNSPTQLESYRNQASQLVQGFLDASIATQAAELDRFYSEKASIEIRNAKPGFWLGVAQSLVGSVLFVFLLGFLVFFTWSLNQGPKQVIEQVFDVVITDSHST